MDEYVAYCERVTPEFSMVIHYERTQDQVPVPSVRDALGQHHTARVLRRAGYEPLPPYHPDAQVTSPPVQVHGSPIVLHTSVTPAEIDRHTFHVLRRIGAAPNARAGGVEDWFPRIAPPEPWSTQQLASLRRVLDFEERR